MAVVIEAERLRTVYGGRAVVDEVSFAVAEGEIFGIVGANGAGKTTTVECLQGLRTPDSGFVRVLGHEIRPGTTAFAYDVGSQLQDAALPDRLRVREALELFTRDGAVDVDETMRTWGLHAHAKSPFGRLSGGLRQRLFIALALLNDPRVVFLDELTQGLDSLARREVWAAIREIRRRGTTVVLVTHYLDEAEALCDRIAVFNAGRIIASGTPAEITAAYAASATVTFSGLAVRLRGLPGVRTVDTRRGMTVVEGAPGMVPYVCAALAASGEPPEDLRIRQPTLEDAIVAIETRTRT